MRFTVWPVASDSAAASDTRTASTPASALTGGGVTKNVQSWRVNLLYSPYPKLDIGAELMFGQRELEDGRDGDLTRLQFTTKYSF